MSICVSWCRLKPYVDTHYRTLPDQPHTCVMGSSMGALISLYALSEYPQVFGGAGCLSTHWPAGGQRLVKAMGAALPKANQHRLYFDFGTTTLDELYEGYQQAMDRWVRAAGYWQGVDWLRANSRGRSILRAPGERGWMSRWPFWGNSPTLPARGLPRRQNAAACSDICILKRPCTLQALDAGFQA